MTPIAPPRSPPSPIWSPPVPPAGWPPRSSPGSRTCPETTSTRELCDKSVIFFDNRDEHPYGGLTLSEQSTTGVSRCPCFVSALVSCHGVSCSSSCLSVAVLARRPGGRGMDVARRRARSAAVRLRPREPVRGRGAPRARHRRGLRPRRPGARDRNGDVRRDRSRRRASRVTITTPDGYVVTLTHLGSIAVHAGSGDRRGRPRRDDRAERRRRAAAAIRPSRSPDRRAGRRATSTRSPLLPRRDQAPAQSAPAPAAPAPPAATQPVTTLPVSTLPVTTLPVSTQPVSTPPVSTQPRPAPARRSPSDQARCAQADTPVASPAGCAPSPAVRSAAPAEPASTTAGSTAGGGSLHRHRLDRTAWPAQRGSLRRDREPAPPRRPFRLWPGHRLLSVGLGRPSFPVGDDQPRGAAACRVRGPAGAPGRRPCPGHQFGTACRRFVRRRCGATHRRARPHCDGSRRTGRSPPRRLGARASAAAPAAGSVGAGGRAAANTAFGRSAGRDPPVAETGRTAEPATRRTLRSTPCPGRSPRCCCCSRSASRSSFGTARREPARPLV